ncbi:MAG: adenylate/guanylate cyclase domain-containing protein [Sandaracinaceae bacterium]
MTQERVEALEAKVLRLERRNRMASAVDQRLEAALEAREPLARVAPDLLALLGDETGATTSEVRTLDEVLSPRTFHVGPALDPEIALPTRPTSFALGPRSVFVHPLDVAGVAFGHVLLAFDEAPDGDAAGLLETFAEELDNHLAAVAAARQRFELIRALSDALKEPVLDRGIDRALAILKDEVDLSDLVLMFRHEDEIEADLLRSRVWVDGKPRSDDPALEEFLHAQGGGFLDGDDGPVRDRLGIEHYQEEVLITGVRTTRVIGRMLATSQKGEFHTHDRELLDRFADSLRQRLVDFNREWKQLAHVFPVSVCERLLGEENYARHLAPRERKVAVLYGDIAGFTRLSEQVLKTPEAIGRLIDTFADGAVEILWAHGGVFDKMVGDCVIGLFGPPFDEDPPDVVCRRALAAARAIREHTRALVEHARLPELAGHAPVDIAVGLNFCPMSVGTFGPNHNFTGFSSGMNNCARLQGVATAGELLCMESFAEALGEDEFEPGTLEADVKNVAEPLRYRRAKG